jgi:ketosteroid isomerase-like protein
MKQVILSFLLTICISANAQSKAELNLIDAINRLHKAMVNGVREELNVIVSDHLTYGHSGGAVENKEAFIEKIVSGKSDFINISVEQQTIDIVKDVALVRHTLLGETNDNGKPSSIKLKVLLVWKKEKGEWRLLARQAVKLT